MEQHGQLEGTGKPLTKHLVQIRIKGGNSEAKDLKTVLLTKPVLPGARAHVN